MEQTFFMLLRSGLWNRLEKGLLKIHITKRQWERIWDMATRQSVRGLVYQGMILLPDDLLPGPELLVPWTAQIDLLEKKNKKMNLILEKMVDEFKESGISPVLLKGQGIAALYENPLWRECGDIDLYFHAGEERIRALEIIAKKNITVRTEPDGSYSFCIQGIVIEIHTGFSDLHSPQGRRMLNTILVKDGFSTAVLEGEHEFRIHILPPAVNIFSLSLHILKHILGHGIGLRQFCDLARAYYIYGNQYSKDNLLECIRQSGLMKWTRQLNKILTEYLAVNEALLPKMTKDTSVSEALMRKIMKGGNFGNFGSRVPLNTNPIKRKIDTTFSLLRNFGFAIRYAPREFGGQIRKLTIGNLK